MLALVLEFGDGRLEHRQVALPASIGRNRHCDIPIAGWRVAREHAQLLADDAGVFVQDKGSIAGTRLNGQRITRHGPLCTGDEIEVGACRLLIERLPDEFQPDGGSNHPAQTSTPAGASAHAPVSGQAQNAETAYEKTTSPPDAPEHASHVVGEHIRPTSRRLSEQQSAQRRYRERLHEMLLQALDLRRRDLATLSDEALRREALGVLQRLVQAQADIPEDWDIQALMQEVVDEAVGLGPLEPLLANDAISEIMVNRFDEIYVETHGSLHRHPARFSSERAVLGIVDRIVSPLGRHVDDSSPMVDARLPDGSRINAVIAPVALRGTSLTIRKFARHRMDMEDLLRAGALDAAMRDFLAACVLLRRNLIVSGGTGSGKTTLLNVLSNCIPEGERIVTIEDAAELRLRHAHLVALEARPANLEGRGQVTIRDLVRNALRMRPDRIVVGECRGGEALDMLSAMNTGHEGSLTTLHANSPRDALARLETMILMAGMDLPLAVVREHIAASVDIIVQQARSASGHRYISAIVEVTGMESGQIQTQELFRCEQGPPWIFAGCHSLPEFLSGNRRPPAGGTAGGADGMDIRLFSQRTVWTPAQASSPPLAPP